MRRAPRLIRLGLLLAALLASPAAAVEPGLLVTVGEVTDSSAVIWVRGVAWGEVAIRYEPVPRASDPPPAELAGARGDIRVTPSQNLTGKLLLQPLEPATRYRYTVSQNGLQIAGEFVTAPGPTVALPVRFVWSSGLGGSGNCRKPGAGYPIFGALARIPTDFFLFVGDTIYADQVCGGNPRRAGYDFVARRLADFWSKHRYNREDPAVQAFYRRTSVYAIWDDHEVRGNFAGPTEPLMEPARRAFIEYFPIQPPRDEPGRLYRKFRWGALLEIFILDTRQYRSPGAMHDGPGKTMLGAAQRRWLIESVSGSSAVWKVVVSSVPLSVPSAGRIHDSWSNANAQGVPEEQGGGYANERDAILRTLRQRGVRNLVFLAGDTQHAELVRNQPSAEWSFHEFIAGPLSAPTGRPRPLDTGLNPRSLASVGDVTNFGDVSIDSGGLTVRILDGEGQVRATETVAPE
ncbi:MAG TPA: alkaline phosphatase D family protein [Methylomirabilota bacterium]|nr:alkaline phosphatase D family protein [Methylomirabilota bacterium]